MRRGSCENFCRIAKECIIKSKKNYLNWDVLYCLRTGRFIKGEILNVLAKFLTASERFQRNSKALDWYFPTRMNSTAIEHRKDPEVFLQKHKVVDDFMGKLSVCKRIYVRVNKRNPAIELLSWDKRLQISVGVARALAFLRTSDRKVIYRDFKASNILLDVKYNTKISDRIMGTYAYAAPEYITTGHLYMKSDVYGFGVVLLKLLTGLQALDTKLHSGQHNLVD
ncbi:Serine/threonine protein kinase [Trema orientale]|uniref:Serine/threonine protein kinase n=1 Tax=Trema orientale TaxID=63057 RepID=A0A2P5G249_TREOI|nr:Serine/threonine protein kinase [Trema orientale]